jgi:hypothetical protein
MDLSTIIDGTPVTRALLFEMIGNDGRFFSCRFHKRGNGELREMNCRLGVKKHLKGGVAAYDREEKNVICVYDPIAEDKKIKLEDGSHPRTGGYRSISVEALIYLRVDGCGFNIIDGKLFHEATQVVIERGDITGLFSFPGGFLE